MVPARREGTVDLYESAWSHQGHPTEVEQDAVDSIAGIVFGMAVGLAGWGGLVLLVYLLVG